MRLGVGYVAAAALLFGAWYMFDSLSYLEGRVEEARSIRLEHRSIAPAIYLDISREFVLEAREWLDPDTTYAVLTGPNVQVSNDLVLGVVPGFMPYALLPRRQVQPAKAEWVLCYGCDRSALPNRVRMVWEGEGWRLGDL